MRIIGGSLSGRRLRAPRGSSTRPTGDRVREALFNILHPVTDARVLDLFAGTGALGLEALSRGAASATFLDSDPAVARLIAENAASLGLSDRVRVLRADALSAPVRLAGERFDLVFIDPPWASVPDVFSRLLPALPPLLAPGARVVLEHDRRTVLDETAGDLATYDHRRYGDTALSFFRMTP